MANYKTPGVYVEEITKFPPSVAQVETAIPAFIGYTEKAEKRNGDSLHLIPTRITSLLEYETYFGDAALETTISVDINDSFDSDGNLGRTIKVNPPSSPEDFLMKYAMQMYFANGGGPCYITSVGLYGAGVLLNDLLAGLAKVRKEDEPTLLLFPDATNLGGGSSTADFYALYTAALTQCNELQDRFTIIDTQHYDEENGTPIADLRNGLPSDKDYAKYGAAYYPFLETILDYRYSPSSVTISHNSEDSQALVDDLASATSALSTVSQVKVDSVLLVDDLLSSDLLIQAGGISSNDSIVEQNKQIVIATSLVDGLNTVVTAGGSAVAAAQVAAIAADEDPGGAGAAATAAANALNDELTNVLNDLPLLIVDLQAQLVAITAASTIGGRQTASTNAVAAVATVEAVIQSIIDLIDPAIITAIADVLEIDVNGVLDGLSLSDIESVDNTVYNQIKVEINAVPIILPPSSAMAGVYARTDSNRGVWKAPANTGVNYVVKPTVQISHEEQEDLNVHTTGKSVNAIRSFTGKGTLVWGARTLAGNDNEWRYVPVRRFFNMVEESVSKASEQFVFEGNDANTWVRIRAMIENFLILQWKAGALTGSKAEQAFYVRVGLGQTMTAQDILEGRMIIEIGMAVVRPAEFIILRFSHKMQEA